MAMNKKTYTPRSVETTINHIVSEQIGDDRESRGITSDTTFWDDLGCDSLDQVELIMFFEEEFEIEISDEEGAKVLALRDAYALVGRKLGKRLQS